MTYLNHTTYSKNESMKREVISQVDTIHDDEQDLLCDELKVVRPEMCNWLRENKEPVHLDVFVVNKIKQVEKQRKKKEEYE